MASIAEIAELKQQIYALQEFIKTNEFNDDERIEMAASMLDSARAQLKELES